MKIKEGGAVENIRSKKIEEIKFHPGEGSKYSFELWIGDSLSYLTINEALELKDMISDAIKKLMRSC